jgi:hypothetical protein
VRHEAYFYIFQLVGIQPGQFAVQPEEEEAAYPAMGKSKPSDSMNEPQRERTRRPRYALQSVSPPETVKPGTMPEEMAKSRAWDCRGYE